MKLRIDLYDEDRRDGEQLISFVVQEDFETGASFLVGVKSAVLEAIKEGTPSYLSRYAQEGR